jgi:ureidoacrylate peracid hydrolase
MQSGAHDLLIALEQRAAPKHAALVVVDVQNDFIADGGYFHSIGIDVKPIQRVVPSIAGLIAKAREAGVMPFFVQAIYDAEYCSDAMRERDLRSKRTRPRCLTGSWGAEFYGVQPLPGEPVVVKHRYSAMIGTQLDPLLKRHGIRSLLFAGVATDTCVESSARDAYFMDYYVTLVSDCCAAGSDSDHQGAVARFARDYGAVVTSDEVIGAWQRG